MLFEQLARGSRDAGAGIIRLALADGRLIGTFLHSVSLNLLTA
jgi:hypothetical protein